jgi:hypothetical protein
MVHLLFHGDTSMRFRCRLTASAMDDRITVARHQWVGGFVPSAIDFLSFG